MADNVTILDSAEVEKTVATHDLGGGVHASKIVHINTDGVVMGSSDEEIAVACQITEDIFHYLVHKGLVFEASTYDASADQFICFKTPDSETYLHLLWMMSSEGNARLDIYEGVTAGAGGSDQVVYNKNRTAVMAGNESAVIAGNSTTANNVQVGLDWTGGTQINPQGYFSSKNSGVVNASHEIVLEKDTLYGFHLVNIDSKDAGMTLTWFEVPQAT